MKKNWLTTALLAAIVALPSTAGIVRGVVVDDVPLYYNN
jgi:hypothetical protein